MDLEFFTGKKVFVTGHTGFKGSWLCKVLINAGAEVTGYSLSPETEQNLFSICGLQKHMHSVIGDIRDYDKLFKTCKESQSDIVLHLAAQPIVRDSYIKPRYTYETNVMGTVNLLECVRVISPRSVVNITTDKVYKNNEWIWGYRENEPLDGFDPYSNSKSCSELVTHCYKNSFFSDGSVALSTARAGNVIGGGDFSVDRIIPDCFRAIQANETIGVRNPHSIRPYQHVLEPIFVYLMIAQAQFENNIFADYYNVGPDECDCVTTSKLVKTFYDKWPNGQTWKNVSVDGPHEANFLKLDSSKLKSVFGWKPCWNIETAIEKTVDWMKCYMNSLDINVCMDNQINELYNVFQPKK